MSYCDKTCTGHGLVAPRRPAIVFVAFVIDAAFCLSLAGFLIMHARLVAANCTTIEMYEKRRTPDWPYNRGMRRNFQDVFGSRRGPKSSLPNCVICMLDCSHACDVGRFPGL